MLEQRRPGEKAHVRPPVARACGLLLVSESRLFREGLAALFAHDAHYRVVDHVAPDEFEAREGAWTTPDLVLLYLEVSNRADTIARIRRTAPSASVFGVSGSARDAVAADVRPSLVGCAPPSCSFDDLVPALRTALDGDAGSRPWLTPGRIPDEEPRNRPAVQPGALDLTVRELEIVRLIDGCLSVE